MVDPSFALPPSDMLAQARAPTVPMPPPGYPVQVVPVQFEDEGQRAPPGNRFVYAGDEVELGDGSDISESSIGEWTTDSGMSRVPSEGSEDSGSSRNRGSSRGSAGSLAVVSAAALAPTAQGRSLAAEAGDEGFVVLYWEQHAHVLAGIAAVVA